MNADLTRVLDLYAGSGALGIEALSRGAGWCDFVERDPALCALIRENLRSTGFEDRSHVHAVPAERGAERLTGSYTLVLADPPYQDADAAGVLQSLADSGLVAAGQSVIVLEHGAKEEADSSMGPFSIASTRRHGDSAVTIYR
jgi:16S rRNA (guanine966-N2)-methyltransferase